MSITPKTIRMSVPPARFRFNALVPSLMVPPRVVLLAETYVSVESALALELVMFNPAPPKLNDGAPKPPMI